MTEEYSLRDLQLMARGSETKEIALELLIYSSYEKFVELIERAIDHVLTIMGRNPELRKDRSEDELTIELVTNLQMMSFNARHDTKIGGHCDVVIEGNNNHSWLGEAKKHSAYDWLMKGFQQLITRYSTGNQNEDRGGFIIYSYNKDLNGMINEWQARLKAEFPKLRITQCTRHKMAFLTADEHTRSGRTYIVRHMPLSLYFDPRDK